MIKKHFVTVNYFPNIMHIHILKINFTNPMKSTLWKKTFYYLTVNWLCLDCL